MEPLLPPTAPARRSPRLEDARTQDARSRPVRPPGVGGRLRAVALTLALATSPATRAAADTFYVDNQCPTCSHAAAGTEAQPYCTIGAAVAARGGPGVTIVVKPGTYREQVNVGGSGAPGLPFVIRAQGPGVVIDGADDFADPALWADDVALAGGAQRSDGPRAWLASRVTWDPNQVFVDGERLTRSSASPDLLPVNAFTWAAGEGLYVNLVGPNPGTRQVRVGRRDHAFSLLSRSWVTIEGFEITRTEDRGISVRTGCSDLVIARNRVSFAYDYGIKVTNGLNLLIDENVISECRYHGIGLVDGTTGCTVRHNECFRNAQPGARIAKGIYLYAAPRNTLIGNRLHDNQDSGLQINKASNDCIVYNNVSWNNGDHGFDHLDASGTLHLNNVAYGNYKDGFSIEAVSPNTRIYNCIGVENGLATDEFNLWVNAASSAGFVADYNIFWNSTGQEPIKYVTSKYATLAAYRAASGQDAHSLQADPLFVDAPGGDFFLLPGSPAIDAGTSAVPFWPTTDAAGNARLDDSGTPDNGTGPVSYVDIGAHEFQYTGDAVLAQVPWRRGDLTALAPAPAAGHAGLIAGRVALSPGFPNPSRGPVEFALDLPQDSRVAWAVYDLQGRMVWSQERESQAGRTVLRWSGTTSNGEPAPAGVYLVRAAAAGVQLGRRVIRF